MNEPLSEVIDAVLALAPADKPPAGFESQGLARLYNGRGRLGGLRRMALRAAAVLVAAGLSGGAVYWAHGAYREFAAKVRSTLATANGQYFTAVPLNESRVHAVGCSSPTRGSQPGSL